MCTDAPLPSKKIGLSPRFFLKGDGTVHRPGPIRLSRTTDGSVALAERIQIWEQEVDNSCLCNNQTKIYFVSFLFCFGLVFVSSSSFFFFFANIELR